MGNTLSDAPRDARDDTFRIRETARRRQRRTSAPLPSELVLHADGSAVVAYGESERMARFDSVGECLVFHDLTATDLEPVDAADSD